MDKFNDLVKKGSLMSVEMLGMQQRLMIGDYGPDFVMMSTLGKISFHEWLGSRWGVLISHPQDFDPVCTTELGRVARLSDEFQKRNVGVIAVSCDTVERHKQWITDINKSQNCVVNFPIIADSSRIVTILYGMLDQVRGDKSGKPMAVRSVVFLAPDKMIKAIITYPSMTGRNINEILRVIDSLQLTTKRKVATPSDWSMGSPCIILPTLSDKDAKAMFGTFNQVLPYLRVVDWDAAEQGNSREPSKSIKM